MVWLRSVWYLFPTHGDAALRLKLLPKVIMHAHLLVVIDENEIGDIMPTRWGPWGDGNEAAGVNDSVGMPRHGRQTVRILILSSLIFYPTFNTPRALGAGSGQLVLGSGGCEHARTGKQRGLVDGGRF